MTSRPFLRPARGLSALRLMSVALLVVGGIAQPQAREGVREWRFAAFLDDKPIGQHTFRVDVRGDVTDLRTEAQFEVNFLFVTAYRYQHRNQEFWEGDCLRSLNSTTDDNGQRYEVRAERGPQGFEVATLAGRAQLPECVMSFAYWNPRMLQQGRLLNTQTGEYVPVQVTQEGVETIEAGGLSLPAYRYRLDAEKMKIWLWYSEAGDWLALRSLTESGRYLNYRLQALEAL